MKVEVEKAALVQTLQKIQNITEKKTSMPILSNVLIKATEQQMLELSVTDLELSLWTQLGGNVQIPGGATVSARKLFEIVKELPQDWVAMESLPTDRLAICAGRSRFELATIPWEDFPIMNFYHDLNYISCDATLVKNSLNKTIYGIPSEDDPFSVAGLYLQPLDSTHMRFVASDGHRLAYVELPMQSLANWDIGAGIIIPRKGVQEILRMVEKEAEVSLGISENCLMVKTTNVLLSVRLLEAQFPEYQLIIPEERPYAFQVERDALYHALKRMAILTDQKWRHVRLSIHEGILELEAGNQELGVANESLDIEYQGEQFTTAFNIHYMMEAIQVLESEQVRFEWVDQFHGGVFLGPQDPQYLSLIMPMVV